jgi:hypothetical protein
MPTKREREYYRMGFSDGLKSIRTYEGRPVEMARGYEENPEMQYDWGGPKLRTPLLRTKPKRKLSAWQKFVKANSKKPRFRYKSGPKKGRINLKALGVAYRKKRR